VSDKVDISGRIAVEDAASPTIKKIEASIGKIGAATRKVGANFSKFANMGALGGVAQNAKNAALSVGRLGSSLFRIAAPLAALAGAAGFGGVVYEMQRYITTTDELAKTSLKLGVGVEQLQMLRHAAKLSGVEISTVENSVVLLTKSMIAAQKGGKNNKQAELFARLGISLKDANGQMRSAADLMPELSNAFMKNTNATTRLQLATTLFGKSGAEMIKLLAGGPEQLQAMYAEMEKLGIITTAEAKAAEQAADAQHRFSTAIAGVRNAVAAKLLPSVTRTLISMTEWTAANRAWISTKIDKFIEGFAEGLSKIPWGVIGAGLRKFGEYLKVAFDALGGWDVVIPAAAALMVGVLVPAIYGVVAAVGALTIALLTNPITLAIAAIATAAVLLVKYWEPIVAFFKNLWRDTKAAFWSGVAWLRDFGNTFARGFIEDAWKPLAAWFGALWEDVRAFFMPAVRWLDAFVGLFVPGGIEGAWQGLTAFFDTLWKGVVRVFEWAWSLIEPIVKLVSGAVEKIKGAGQAIGLFRGGAPGEAVPERTAAEIYGGGGTAETVRQASEMYGGVIAAASDMSSAAKVIEESVAGPTAAQQPDSRGPLSRWFSQGAGAAAAPGPVRSAADMYGGAPVQAEIKGKTEMEVRITADPSLRVSQTTRDTGDMHSTVEVGRSMVPA
jgi:hypothetical protein